MNNLPTYRMRLHSGMEEADTLHDRNIQLHTGRQVTPLLPFDLILILLLLPSSMVVCGFLRPEADLALLNPFPIP